MHQQKLMDEEGRLAALARYCIIDTRRDDGFETITALVRDILNVPICAISLIERDRQWFKSISGLEATETARDIAFCGHTILYHDPLLIPDATADARFSANPLVTGEPGIRSYAGVPLRSPDGYNVGSLCAIDTNPRVFTEVEICRLEAFAVLVMKELELRTIAHLDFLTGALTRRAFVEAVADEVDRCRRYGRVSSLVIFDLDHFKRVNDAFGHPAGDDVLKMVAQTCSESLKPSAMLGRLGGEEFGILLPETNAAAAFQIAERLRRNIKSLRFEWAADVSVSVSLGTAAYASGQSVDDWFTVADAALYSAKRQGRNRTIGSTSRVGKVAA